MKGDTNSSLQRPKHNWRQTEENVSMVIAINDVPSERLDEIEVIFAVNDLTIKLPDGDIWIWYLFGDIVKEHSKVKIKKQKLHLLMEKKEAIVWSQFEADKIPTDAGVNNTESGVEQVDNQSTQSTINDDIPSDQTNVNTTVSGDECIEDKDGKKDDDNLENIVKDEEPVVELKHLKHDFIEKPETFCVHIYVKNVNKDNLYVKFDEDCFIVKFQTSHPQFLKLYEGSSEDTKFCWQVKLRGETIKEKCHYRITPSFIELSLAKKSTTHWGDLEALKRKESSNKSESWVSVNSVSTKTDEDFSSDRKSMFNEMKQNIEKGNLNDKAPDAGLSEVTSQKPTCKVQPLNTELEDKSQAVKPGFTGLDNLGNTCFMSGVLQCLMNSREFRDYFIDGSFQKDINVDNVLGSGGKLAVAYAVLCKSIWSGKHYSIPPSKLKNLVAQKASQFTGFAQHDSQEFLAFLLDGLHEDLNRIKKKPYTETIEDGGRPDEIVANEAWVTHKKRNDSFVVDLFHGQYKSKLVCPVCGKVSITFDPFVYLSLPLPKRQRLLPVTFIWKDPYRKPIRYMLRLSKDATVEALKDALKRKTGVHSNNIRVFEAYKGKIHKLFSRGANLSLVQANDCIIACEVLSEEVAGEPVFEVAVVQRTLMPNQFPSKCSSCKKLCPEGSKLKRCSKCFRVGYCDQTCQKTHWQYHKSQCRQTPEPVGTPFIISIPESRATFSQLCKLMEAYARYSVDVFQPPVKTETAPKLTSRLSSSNLSNSSQSSGSQNSLDSQSSFSSTCTITAQEQNVEDADFSPDCDDQNMSLPVDCDSAQSCQTGLSSATSSVTSDNTGTRLADGKTEKDMCNISYKSESGYGSMKDINTSANTGVTSVADVKSTSDKEYSHPVKPVLGIQTGDTERTTPMFYIKPVNSDGIGLTGPDGERLDDKGDIALDLTNKLFLSLDWKNNDKLPGYALVQSKDMDFENDSSMMQATLEESNATLEQCLELFTEPEVLSPDEAWYCPQCKEHREATKQLSIWKLPHTLIIQLKRFSFRNFIWRDKIDKMVEFATRGLDLSAYYIGNRPSDEPAPVYDLYGVVNHHGGILGGHYTSYVRCADTTTPSSHCNNLVGWRLCDDSRVTAVSHEKNVVTKSAYLLFYRRRQAFTPSPLADLLSDECIEEDEEEYQSASSDIDETGEPVCNPGRLVIDESSPLDDNKLCNSSPVEESETVSVSGMINVDADNDSNDLGYTDMDSVD
ncbi:Ubiquitin carboxyl-terminal hydrolase 19 [Mactra antiquata]